MKRRANAAYHWMEGNPATAILVCSGLSALVAITLTAALGVYSTSTFEGKTACGRDPSGPECAKLRQEVARAEPLTNPCISFQRVTSEKGRNCPEQFVYKGHRARPTATQPRFQRSPQSSDNGSGEGVAPDSGGSNEVSAPDTTGTTGTTGAPAPQVPDSDLSPAPKGGRATPSPAPTTGPPDAPSPPAAGVESEQNTPQAAMPPSVLESAGTTVGEVAKGAGQVLEATTCGLTAPLLCPKK